MTQDRERQLIYDALCEILLYAEDRGGYYQCNYSVEEIKSLADKYNPQGDACKAESKWQRYKDNVYKLRSEIERLKEVHERNLDKPMERGRIGHAHGYVDCCDELLSFIDSLQQEQIDMGEVSDGYHTFNELYYYRMLYNAAFFNSLPKELVYKSKRHHTGEECFGGGWFIVMANLPTGQISNHYELKDWDLFKVPEKEIADEWDGHTPQEAAERLHKYLQQEQPEKEIVEEKEFNEVYQQWFNEVYMKKFPDLIDIAQYFYDYRREGKGL